MQENRIPPMDEVIKYFVRRAPEQLDVPEDALGLPPSPVPFKRHMITLDAIPSPPAISGAVRAAGGRRPGAIADLRYAARPGGPLDPLPSQGAGAGDGRVPNPCRAQVVDLDGDGLRDILVCNLGEFWPLDTDKGSLVWLRNRGGGRFENITIDKLSRVCDVRAVDFDGKGKLDLVVAAFGQVNTGGLVYLENCTTDWSHPDFEKRRSWTTGRRQRRGGGGSQRGRAP